MANVLQDESHITCTNMLVFQSRKAINPTESDSFVVKLLIWLTDFTRLWDEFWQQTTTTPKFIFFTLYQVLRSSSQNTNFIILTSLFCQRARRGHIGLCSHDGHRVSMVSFLWDRPFGILETRKPFLDKSENRVLVRYNLPQGPIVCSG